MSTSSFNPVRTHADAATVSAASPGANVRNHPPRGLAAMLLAAIVAALVVVADSVVDSYADGHLLAGWIVLWAVGFAALAMFAGAARNAGTALSSALHGWAGRRVQHRSDADLLFAAQSDPRIMADIQAAVGYAASMGETPDPHAPRKTGAVGSMRAAITRRLQSNADIALWQTAQRDPRIMAEVQAAMHRTAVASESMDQALGRAWLARHPVGTFNAAYVGPGRTFRAMPMPGLPTHLQYLPG